MHCCNKDLGEADSEDCCSLVSGEGVVRMPITTSEKRTPPVVEALTWTQVEGRADRRLRSNRSINQDTRHITGTGVAQTLEQNWD